MAEDEYARDHMAGGRVLLRDKRVAGRGFQSLMLVPTALFSLAALCGLGAALAGVGGTAGWLVAGFGAVMGALGGLSWITGSVLRTVVTERELHVSAGLSTRRISLDRIRSCRLLEQRNRLKVGHRMEEGMLTHSMLVATGEYVEVVWTHENGSDRRLRFSPQDPHAVARALELARGAQGEPAPLTTTTDAAESVATADGADSNAEGS